MHASLKAPMALGLILAIPLIVLPTLGAPAREPEHKPAHSRASAFANAGALASPAARDLQAPETDGLSRKDEECVFGCIDH